MALILGVAAVRMSAQTTDLAGRWTLNRGLSQFPPEIGFTPDWVKSTGTASPGSSPPSGGRGRRGGGGGSSGGGRSFAPVLESEDDAKRMQQLTADARNPSMYLTIVETGTTTTITDDSGEALTFYADGRHEVFQVGGISVGATAKRGTGRLEVAYEVERDRTLRYSYSRSAANQLVVDVQFVEHGKLGDHVTRVYDSAAGADAATASTPSSTSSKSDAEPPLGMPKSAASASAPAAPGTFAQEPGAELKGVKKIGLVVEASGPQATACGLNQAALETALSKRLTDAGLNVRLDADEDTYVYINVMTSHAPNDLCVSRYDAFLYTHTTASLSYHATPVLVQVSLLHEGGLSGGASANHPDAVRKGLEQYVDQFSARIHDANKP
jgi:hypothetical protein